jgi:hypothetical protein
MCQSTKLATVCCREQFDPISDEPPGDAEGHRLESGG